MSFTEHAFDCQRQAFKLSELFIRSESSESLKAMSLTIKSMFCKREKVPVSNVNQQSDKPTQVDLYLLDGLEMTCYLVVIFKKRLGSHCSDLQRENLLNW